MSNLKPILFNTAMVQAILKNRKTTTRRIIKDVDNNYTYLGSDKQKKTVSFARNTTGLPINIKIPYKALDILYVRETWLAHSRGLNTLSFMYKADDTINDKVSFTKERFDKFYKFADKEKWQPSLFMPKEAARIFLKVKYVRVERLQDIDDEGSKREGANVGIGVAEKMREGAIDRFKRIWDSTVNKKDIDMYGFNANPYVWVIEFEKIDKSEVECNE